MNVFKEAPDILKRDPLAVNVTVSIKDPKSCILLESKHHEIYAEVLKLLRSVGEFAA